MTDITFTVPGPLQAWQRAGRGKNGSHFTQAKTRSAERSIGWHAIQQCGQRCLQGPLDLTVVVHMAIPPSWSAKRRQEALDGSVRPTGKPDADNLAKGVCDALNHVLWGDDAQVVDLHVSKRFATTPFTTITVKEAHL